MIKRTQKRGLLSFFTKKKHTVALHPKYDLLDLSKKAISFSYEDLYCTSTYPSFLISTIHLCSSDMLERFVGI